MELHRLAEELKAIYSEFLPPSGFLAIFPSGDKEQASQHFYASVKKRMASQAEWSEVRTATREGPLSIQLNDEGRAITRPLGIVINEVLFDAAKPDERR